MSLELLQDIVEFDSVKLKIVVRFKIKKLKKKNINHRPEK